jgi:hypothetical protein
VIVHDAKAEQRCRLRRVSEYSQRSDGPFHNCHVMSKGAGGSTIPQNLCRLTWDEHGDHHAGREPTQQTLLGIVARREGCSADTIWEYLNWLRNRAKEKGFVAFAEWRTEREAITACPAK